MANMRIIDNSLYWSGVPSRELALQLLREHNVKLFVNLYGYYGYEEEVKREGAEVIVRPIDDMCFAPIEEVHVEVLDKILKAIDEGKRVLVHCYAGIGRSGTLVCMYLIRKGDRYHVAFDKVKRSCPLWPESLIQQIAPRWYDRLIYKVGEKVMRACYKEGSRYYFGGSLGHASSVANIALDILEEFINKHILLSEGWEWRVVYVAGLLHDIGHYDSSDEVHHLRSVELISHLRPLRQFLRGKELEYVKFLVATHRSHIDPLEDDRSRLLESRERAILLSSAIKIADAFYDVYTMEPYGGCSLEGNELIMYTESYLAERISRKSIFLDEVGIKVRIETP
ncbi:MAG: hypothetical protein DRM97_05420 [Thermoprotei archaeon]|nr:MAG: hypothetical protein DRM97_05420 [Thermoprotei archaeon]